MGQNMVILKNKNFILRHPRLSDLEDCYKNQNDPVAKKMFMTTPKNISEAKKELLNHINENKKKRKHQENFVIDIGGKAVGEVWISHIAYDYEKHKASFGYVLRKEYRGRGITTAAVKLLTDYAFKKYKLKRMYTHTRIFNKPSRQLLEKAGFKIEGILRKNKWKNGKYLDDCLYAKVK